MDKLTYLKVAAVVTRVCKQLMRQSVRHSMMYAAPLGLTL